VCSPHPTQQLVGTCILFKHIPNEVLLSKPTKDLLSEAVNSAYGVVHEKLKIVAVVRILILMILVIQCILLNLPKKVFWNT